MYAQPSPMTRTTIVTLSATMHAFTQADSEMPIISMIEMAQMMKMAGRLTNHVPLPSDRTARR